MKESKMKYMLNCAAGLLVLLVLTILIVGCDGSGGSSSSPVLGTPAPTIGVWTPIAGAPTGFTPRSAAVTHWTGSEMLVYAGEDAAGSTADGAFYDLATDTWRLLSTTAAPSHRTDLYNFRESFTGDRLLIWSGRSSNGPYYGSNTTDIRFDGGIYDLVADTWTPMQAIPASAPFAGRAYLHGLWTGSKLLVWGGNDTAEDGTSAYTYLASEPAYGSIFDPGADWGDPADDSWTAMSILGAPLQRKHGVAVWTGGTDNRMLSWGGAFGDPATVYYNDGALYDPATDTWTPISNIGAPAGRKFAFYAWTGTQLIVWGGLGTGDVALDDGGIYDLVTDSWTAITTTNAPSARGTTTGGIWTGSHFIVFGGMEISAGPTFSYPGDGGIYDPATDTWTPIPVSPELVPAGKIQIVWTGFEIIVWSGWTGGATYSSAGAVLTLDPSYYP
jgi:hypothetical protein